MKSAFYYEYFLVSSFIIFIIYNIKLTLHCNFNGNDNVFNVIQYEKYILSRILCSIIIYNIHYL